MSWKYEKEFRADHPETIGETDKELDLDNYKDWAELKIEKLFSMHFVSISLPECTNCGKRMKLAAYQCRCGMVKEA
jgi:hypothetical protein